MSMQFKFTYCSDQQADENVDIATVIEGSNHPFLTIIDGMISAGTIKFSDEIENWQGFPEAEGFAKSHQAEQFLAVTKSIAKSKQFVFPEMFRALELLKQAASGKGRIYISYF